MPARFACRRGAAYLGPTENENNPDIKQKHLFIVLTEPSEDGEAVTVGVSTVRDSTPDDELTCKLNKGDHPFIRHQSYADYKRARIEKASMLENKYARKMIRPMEDLDDEVLRRVCAGLLKSKKVRLRVQEFYEQNAHPR